MLVLTRKLNEEIVVPEFGITFRILEVRGERVRVGIVAPPDVEVYRREVWVRMLAANGQTGEPGASAAEPGASAAGGSSR